MNTQTIGANTGDEKCEPVLGMEGFLACEAKAIKGALLTLLTS